MVSTITNLSSPKTNIVSFFRISYKGFAIVESYSYVGIGFAYYTNHTSKCFKPLPEAIGS